MQFLNIYMLLGLAAVAIPIVIQLLNRKNVRRTDWGAWMFLDRTMKKRKRKVLLEDILLLACRCLAAGLLALAFARPFVRPDSPIPWAVTLPVMLLATVLTGASFALWRYPRQRKVVLACGLALFAVAIGTAVAERVLGLKRFGGGAAKDVVLLIDGSASMSFESDGKANFERAKEEAKKYVASAPEDTSFAVVIGGPVPQVVTPVPVPDRRMVLNAIDRVRPANGTMQMQGCLAAAAVTLASGHNAVKHIVVIGDGQAVGWNLDDPARWKTTASVFRALKMDPVVTWRTLPLPTSMRNLAVSGVRPARDVVGTDREVGINVTVVNAGTEAVTPKGVSLTVEGVRLEASGMRQLEPGESQVFAFAHRFSKPGGTIVTARVESGDDMPGDDTYRYAMPVAGSLRALVVDGDSGLRPMDRASTYVRLALRPQFQPDSSRDFLVDAVVEDVSAAAGRDSFGGFAAVFLVGVRRLPAQTLDALARFVRAGAGLFFMPSQGVDAGLFGSWEQGGEKVLPAVPGKWRDGGSPLDASSFSLQLAKLRSGTDLASAAPMKVMDMSQGLAEDADVFARLADGTPFLVSRRFGRGLVVESAAQFDPASGLVSKRGFLPLVHEIAYSLAKPASVDLDVRPAEGLTLLVASGTAGGEAGGENGLVGYYYPEPDFKGKPQKRIDANIVKRWGGGSPMAGIPADRFSVRWRGAFVPPASGTYEFAWEVDDRFSAKLGTTGLANRGKVQLDGGKAYPFSAAFGEDWGEARVVFRWKRPGADRFEDVPRSAFRTRAAGVEGAGETVQVTDPHGEAFYGEIFQGDDGLFLRISRSVIPGVYEVSEIPDTLASPLAGALSEDGRLRFTVSSGSEESSVVAVTQSQLSDLGSYIQVTQALKEDDVVNAIAGQGFGREVWRLLALAAFLLLVAEPAIARWIAVNRRTGDLLDTEGSWIRT